MNAQARFYPLKVTAVRNETKSCKSIQFEVPKSNDAFFRSKPGQYVTLSVNINGIPVRRCYSICEQDSPDTFCIAVKKVPKGTCSTYLIEHLQVGDTLDAMPPMGMFTIRDTDDHRADVPTAHVAFAAGSGITPVMAIMRFLLKEKPNLRFTLIYQNANRAGTIFREELLDLKNKYMDRCNLIFIFSREPSDIKLHSGRLNEEKLDTLFESFTDIRQAAGYYLCGPEEMTDAVQAFLAAKGISSDKFITEHFINQGQRIAKLYAAQADTPDVDGECTADVHINGVVRTVSIPFNEPILDSLLKNGINAPFACQGGVCSTCKIKLTDGELRMPVNYSLEKDQLDKNFYLSCSSFPVSKKVRISYDV